MPRVKRGVTARARHKKLLALSKGYSLRANNVFRVAKEAVMRGAQYAYRDRRAKKRVFRRVDCPYQCGYPSERNDLQRLHQRPSQGEHPP